MSNLLQLKNISAGYEGKTVLREVNLNVNPNDFVGIIGPNGGGKTTLLKVLLELIEPYQGSVVKKDGLRIGYLPQINTIDKKFPISVKEVILSGRHANNWKLGSNKKNAQKIDELLQFVGMNQYKDTAIGDLSGGQMQRIFLCRALISNPHLLILDEPNTYVDKTFEENLYNLLSELNKDMAILLVSHDVGTISSMVKTIACVNGGLHYHESNKITNEVLKSYNCPIEIISHGTVPHRVLKTHKHE
ncbi:metal ABC transporter ATP-binding protein [Carboxylicivirga linearis]|uniref:Metal ABC transporter ATP-binding protein n=1 Tax=Carboxylicivirga linearis TaxID=1628157 RepID=A0ABS5JR61_9BACT|nr:metal ABC transporter ATP-binding protein [Carboxylicivirga linearis]MBS2096896.1 metal ABC transporter ATP-binding protein [Carboxylicivirga linearis]